MPVAPRVPAAALPARAAGSYEFVVLSPSTLVGSLSYTGSGSVTSGAATVPVLNFSAGSITFQGLQAVQPCLGLVGTASLEIEGLDAQHAAFTGPITMSVSYLAFSEWDPGTSSYVAVAYNGGSPPTSTPPTLTADSSHPLLNVVMVATTLQAAAATYVGTSSFVEGC